MEPAAAVLMLKSKPLQEANVNVEVLVGDADSSTAAAVRQEFGDTITRALDVTHAKKNFKNSLYNLQKTYRPMTKQAILYLTATVGTVISKNRGSPAELEAALLNIPDHVFNHHDNCSPDWCRFYDDPSNYKSKYLAKHLGDHGGPLHAELKSCCEKLARKAEELSVGGSTQACESFNNTVSMKAPKNKHYGGTESLTFRVNAAVLQKNEGVDYTLQVCKELALSPGKLNKILKKRVKTKRLRDNGFKKSPKNKARRKLSLVKRGQYTSRNETLEGVSYRSGMVFDDPQATTKQRKVWKPQPFVGTLPKKLVNKEYIFFDLETSGLNTTKSEILQISATSTKGDFNAYCTPLRPISYSASQTNLLTVHNGALQHKGQPVVALPIKDALKSFIQYLAMHGNCILVAHNAPFDLRFLVHNLKIHKLLNKTQKIVVGFIDTLKIFRRKFAAAKKCKTLKDFKLTTLCKFLLGDDYNFEAHNAQADVEALKLLYEAAAITSDEACYGGRRLTAYLHWIKLCKKGEQLENLAQICGMKISHLKLLLKNKWDLHKLEQLAHKKTVVEFTEALRFLTSDIVQAMYSGLTGIGDY
jgi:DNA polymerase III epsilon subunit-like protein